MLNFNGGILDLNGNNVTAGLLAGATGTVIDNLAGPGTTVLTINQGSDSAFAGTIANGATRTVGVTKAGAGTLTLSGNNSFTGPLTITQGAVIAAGDGANIPVAANVTLGDGSNTVFLIAGAAGQQFATGTVVRFNNGAKDSKFQLRGTNQTIEGLESTADPSFSLAIVQNDEVNSPGYVGDPGLATLTLNTQTDHVFAGLIRNQVGGGLSLVKEGPATQEIRNILVTTNNYTSTIVNEGRLVFNYTPNGNITNTLPVTMAITVNAGGTLVLDGTLTANSVIDGDGPIVKQGTGTVTLAGVNTFTNGITVEDGTLQLGGDFVLGAPTVPLRMNGGGVRAAGATREVPNPVMVNNSFVLGRQTNLNGGLALTVDAAIIASNPDGPANNTSSLSAITGDYRVTFAEAGSGIGTGAFIVNGINTNSGGTTMASGRVNVSPLGALSNASLVVNGGELNFNNTTQSITSLSGAGGRINLGFGHTLTVTQAADTSFDGTLGSGGTLVKAGGGNLTLSGNSTAFFGSLEVNAGTLFVNGNLNGSTTTISGGRLAGNGTVGSVTLNSGALSPGLSPGTLNTGSLFLSGGLLEFEINGLTPGIDYDQLNVAGTISLLQNIPILLTLTTAVTQGDTFTLINNDDFEPVDTTGLLTYNGNPLSEGEFFAVGAQAFQISYAGGLDNNDIVIIAIPEPNAAVALVSGLGVLAGLRRRRS